MKKESTTFIMLLIIFFVVTILIFAWFAKSEYFLIFNSWVKGNTLFFVVALFIIKSLGILWPPIPSGLFTLAAIPILGWPGAYFIDLAGSALGGSVAYIIGGKYGYRLLEKIFDSKIIEKIKKIKIKKGKEIEAVFIYRLVFGSTIIEAIYYGAGVLKIPFTKFLIGTVLSHFLVGMPTFLLAGNIFEGKNMLFSLLLSIIAIFFLFRTKGRYLE